MRGGNKKYDTLQMLKKNFQKYSSGEELSNQLGVSRTAVWKHIKELQSEGYAIEASSRKGYKLVLKPQILNGYEIAEGLATSVIGRNIVYFDTIDSTNNHAKRIAIEETEETEGTVIAAGSQTEGRGRLGRNWLSPPDSGIYFSVILKPKLLPEEVQIVTLAGSVAVAAALWKLTGMEAGIKWPNDVLLDGKKICGILTEMNCEMEQINYVVLGIGINFSFTDGKFPPELENCATSIRTYAVDHGIDMDGLGKLDIIRAVLKELDELYELLLQKRHKDIIKAWKKHGITIGKNVHILSGETSYEAFAEDISEDGKLLVRCIDGSRRQVMSGEVSLRL